MLRVSRTNGTANEMKGSAVVLFVWMRREGGDVVGHEGTCHPSPFFLTLILTHFKREEDLSFSVLFAIPVAVPPV